MVTKYHFFPFLRYALINCSRQIFIVELTFYLKLVSLKSSLEFIFSNRFQGRNHDFLLGMPTGIRPCCRKVLPISDEFEPSLLELKDFQLGSARDLFHFSLTSKTSRNFDLFFLTNYFDKIVLKMITLCT